MLLAVVDGLEADDDEGAALDVTCASLASGVPSAPIQIDKVPSNSLTYLRCCSVSLDIGTVNVSSRAGLPPQESAFSALNTDSSTRRASAGAADTIGRTSLESSLASAQTVGVFAFASRASSRDSASTRTSVSFA